MQIPAAKQKKQQIYTYLDRQAFMRFFLQPRHKDLKFCGCSRGRCLIFYNSKKKPKHLTFMLALVPQEHIQVWPSPSCSIEWNERSKVDCSWLEKYTICTFLSEPTKFTYVKNCPILESFSSPVSSVTSFWTNLVLENILRGLVGGC